MIVLYAILIYLGLFATKLAVTGNPAVTLVRQTPLAVLKQAVETFEEEEEPEDDLALEFLRRFSLSVVQGVWVLVIETGMAIYMIMAYPDVLIPWLLLGKNTLLMMFARHLYQQGPENPVEICMYMPDWALRVERLGYAMTAAAALILLLVLWMA